MINTIFQYRPKTITRNDIAKHNLNDVTFYSMSYGTFVDGQLVYKTDLFSNQILIEIDRGANKTIIGTPSSNLTYTRASVIEFDQANGKGFIYWQAVDDKGKLFYIVKLLAEDFTTQIKIMTPDQKQMTVHNVCELPQK